MAAVGDDWRWWEERERVDAVAGTKQWRPFPARVASGDEPKARSDRGSVKRPEGSRMLSLPVPACRPRARPASCSRRKAKGQKPWSGHSPERGFCIWDKVSDPDQGKAKK